MLQQLLLFTIITCGSTTALVTTDLSVRLLPSCYYCSSSSYYYYYYHKYDYYKYYYYMIHGLHKKIFRIIYCFSTVTHSFHKSPC